MPVQQSIKIRRIKTGSVFKLLAVSLFSSLVPFAILMGVLGFFGFNTITWNNQQLYGVTALVASPFIGALVAALFTGFVGLMVAFGSWIFSKFKPVTIEVVVEDGGGAV